MKTYLIPFKLIFKPLTRWAVLRALVGRNRFYGCPEKGRFTHSEVESLLEQTWRALDCLAPNVSKEPTIGSRMNVLLAALTLAFFQSLTDAEIERDHAIELAGDTCWYIYQNWGRIGKFLGRLFSPNLIQNHIRRVGKDGSWPMSFPFNPPGYLARYMPTEKGIGFNVIRCPVAEFFHKHSARDLGVGTWCMLDYPLAEMLNLRLERTQTLLAGGDHCDFRWFAAKVE